MTTNLRVLIVEDVSDDAELLLLELTRSGFAPISRQVDSTEDMAAALADERWDIVVSDYSMPNFGAMAALTLCRAADPDLPFIVVSGTIGEDRAVEMMRAGANDYLLKGSLARLAPVIERELREVGNRRLFRQSAQAASLLAAIVESSDDAIYSQTLDGIVTSWNPAAERLFGWKVAEAIGRHVTFLAPPEKAGEFATVLMRLRLGEHFEQLETIRLRKDGTRCEVSITFSPIRDREGRIIGVSKVARDITARKLADGERQVLQSIIEFSPSFIAVAKPDYRAVFLNRAGRELVGIDTAESVSQSSIPDFFGAAEWQRIESELIPILREGGHYVGVGNFRHFKTGEPIPVDWVAFAIPDTKTGLPAFFACVANDSRERKKAEETLRASEEQFRQQSHILRSILDHMSEGIVVADEGGKFLLVNPAAKQLFNPNRIQVQPEQWSETYQLYLADGKTPFPAAEMPLSKALQGEPSDEIEMIVKSKTLPEPRWISVSARPRFDDMGVLRGGISVIRNITEKKKAEQLLRASEQEFRLLAEAMPQMVWITRADGWNIYFNQQWMDFTGLTLEQSIGNGWSKPFHPEDQQQAWLAWQQATKTTGTYSVQCRLRRADGVYRWFLIRGIPVKDSAGSILKWFGTCTDIDDLKRSEAERAALVNQLNLQIERMPLAYLLSGPNFRFTRWNPSAERLFGFKEAEILGQHPLETIVPPQSKDLVTDVFARLAAGDMNAHGTCENVTKDGRTIICQWQNTPLFGLDGAFHGILSLAQDVTDREVAERALRLRDRAIQAATQGLIITDANLPDNPIIFVNPGFERITGYRPEEVIGRNCRFLQGKDTNPDDLTLLRNAIKAEQTCTLEILNYKKDGSPFWNELSISPVHDGSGKLTHFIGVQADITARRKLEEQFRQAQKMDAFGQLAGGVAHDFNNLLTIINGYSELLISSLSSRDPNRKLVDEILKAGERSAGLTRQLLAFSRQQILAPRILNLNDVVNEIDKMLRRLIGEDVRLTTTLATKLRAIRADPGQIEQVLLNLAVNARDAMPTGGRLTIETQNVELDGSYTQTHADVRPGRYVLLSVADTGTGMSPEVQARIFEPFFTTKGIGKGTGLGLATVYGIVKHTGGHIAVYSEIGVGTTFKVYLPQVEDMPELAVTPSRVLTPPRGTETVLLAEDEAGVRTLASHILTGRGYKVLQASDGEEALKLANAHNEPIHLLITDVVMPGAGGRTVAEQVVERHPGIRVLFISGYTDDAIIRHGVLRDGVDFLQKPFTPATLAYKVREVLDAPGKQ